jgi:3',5'-cyclic AMP phosphodiesterase CpdA
VQRREFLKSLAISPALAAVPFAREDQRFGDLLIQKRSSDRFDLIFTPSRPRPLRLLQLADTHFHPDGDKTNTMTAEVLRGLVDREQPDFLIHTGDFVNNDSKDAVGWEGMSILNGLEVPWTLCFGNHDYPVNKAPGSLPLDEIRTRMERGFQGYLDAKTGRHYCYRYDLKPAEDAKPAASLFFFQVGYAPGDRRISNPQLVWFGRQMDEDRAAGVDAPIVVFVHIPLIEYDHLFESGKAEGLKGEDVCFDSDTGLSFAAFKDSGRVRAVFCGHDHVNNYHGDWEGVDLSYGRVSGWGGYGPDAWKRGGRLISLDLAEPGVRPGHVEVF